MLKVIPSLCSVVSIIRNVYKETEPKAISQSVVDYHRRFIDAGVSVRNRIPKGQLLDLNYEDLLQNPLRTVRDVYAYFNLPWQHGYEARINEYLKSNQQNAHGEHTYSLEELGLTKDGLLTTYRNYIESCHL